MPNPALQGTLLKPGALQRVLSSWSVGVSGVGLRVAGFEVGTGAARLQDSDDVALPRQSRTEAVNEEAIEHENRRGQSNLSNMLPRFGMYIFGEVLQNSNPNTYIISDELKRNYDQ